MADFNYQTHIPIQPAPIVSDVPTWKAVESVANTFEKTAEKEILSEKKAKIQANKYQMASLLNTLDTNARNEAIKSPAPATRLDIYNKNLNEGMQTILNNTLPANQPLIRNRAVFLNNMRNKEFTAELVRKNQQETLSEMTSAADNNSNMMSNLAASGNIVGALHYYAFGSSGVKDFVKAGGNSHTAAIMQTSLNKTFYKQVALGEYRTAAQHGKGAEYRKDFSKLKDKRLPGITIAEALSAEDIHQLNGQFDAIDREIVSHNEMTTQALNQKIKEVKYKYQHGISVSQGDLVKIYQGNPKNYPAVSDGFKHDQTQSIQVENIRGMKYAGQKTEIIRLKNASPKSLSEDQDNKAILTRVEENTKLLETNPITAIKKMSSYRKDLAFEKTLPDFNINEFNLRYQRNINLPEKYQSVLSKEQAAKVVNDLANTDLASQVAVIGDQVLKTRLPDGSLVRRYTPQQRRIVMRDLQRAGMSHLTSRLFRISESDKYKQYTGSATIAFKSKLSDYDATFVRANITSAKFKNIVINADSIQNQLNTWSDTHGDTTKIRNQYLIQAQLLGAQLLRDHKAESPDDAAESAGQILNAGVAFDSFRGTTYAYDKTIPADTIHKMLAYQLAKAQKEHIEIPRGIQLDLLKRFGTVVEGAQRLMEVAGAPITSILPSLSPEYINKLMLSQASFQTTSDGTGLVLVDYAGNPFKDVKGNEYRMSFEDMKNPNSESMIEMHKYFNQLWQELGEATSLKKALGVSQWHMSQ